MPTVQMGMFAIKKNPEDIKKLPQILAEHSEWLKDHSKGRRADLAGMDLEEVDLSGQDLSYADLTGTCLMKAKLVGTNLYNASMEKVILMHADLHEANLKKANLFCAHADRTNFEGACLIGANLSNAVLWDARFKGAELMYANLAGAQICDCDFESANLHYADLHCTDMDNAIFAKANLHGARIVFAQRIYWANFTDADVTYVDFSDCSLDEKMFKGAKGFRPHMCCPEEGSFVAWKKCSGDKIVKLLIPENAQRTGMCKEHCRASEVKVLEITDSEGNKCEEAVSITDDSIIYRVGETVRPNAEFDNHMLIDGIGIHFYLTRTEAEDLEIVSADDEEEEDCEDEE